VTTAGEARSAPRVVLAPGASGNAASMRPYVERLRRRGIEATAIDLPKGKAERAVDPYRVASKPGADVVIGGRSYGGRVASLLAAEVPVAGLLLISYPLHAPGRTNWQERTAHWPDIECPVLLLAGDADPFAKPSFLRSAARRLRHVEIVRFPDAGHGLEEAIEPAMEKAAEWVRGLAR
jgi:predicted alpha/beta-hydrolase family hydrolase